MTDREKKSKAEEKYGQMFGYLGPNLKNKTKSKKKKNPLLILKRKNDSVMNKSSGKQCCYHWQLLHGWLNAIYTMKLKI